MKCDVCKDRELDSRCPACKRLPKDPQLAILSEAHDILKRLGNIPKLEGNEFEIISCLKVLTGVVTKLVKDTSKLRYPYGTRKGIPKHSPHCSIHDIPHDHCDCIINRQPKAPTKVPVPTKVPRLQEINWERGEYGCLSCGEVPVQKDHKCK